jgi:hypothetical protein
MIYRANSAADNDAGGKRLVPDLADLGMACRAESKCKSRVVVAQGPAAAASDRLDAALVAGSCQPVLEGRYIRRPGMFCRDRVDTGSAGQGGGFARWREEKIRGGEATGSDLHLRGDGNQTNDGRYHRRPVRLVW